MATRIQLRRDTSSNWNILDPALAEGEVGFETDTGKIKIGDGSSVWSELNYFLDSLDLSEEYVTIPSASATYLSQSSASTTYAIKENPSINAGIDFYTTSAASFVGDISVSSSMGREMFITVPHQTSGANSTLSLNPNQAQLTTYDGSTYSNSLTVYPTYISADYGTILNILEYTSSASVAVSDNGKFIKMNSSSANTLTIPSLSDSLVPIGSQITVMQTGTGQTTIAAGSGMTVNATPGLKLRARWSSATLIKLSSTMWVAVGDLTG